MDTKQNKKGDQYTVVLNGVQMGQVEILFGPRPDRGQIGYLLYLFFILLQVDRQGRLMGAIVFYSTRMF